jgi:hypothetical protein
MRLCAKEWSKKMITSLLSAVAATTITINGNTSTVSEDSVFAVIGAAFLALMIPIIIVAILGIIAMWKIFTKCGEAGWKSIIPIYNMVILLKIVGINPLWILIMVIPIVGGIGSLLLTIVANIRLAKGFGKSEGFAVGLILLSFIFDLILAFDKSTWDASRINYDSFSFLNAKDLPKGKGPAAKKEDAKGTPEDPWVEGK